MSILEYQGAGSGKRPKRANRPSKVALERAEQIATGAIVRVEWPEENWRLTRPLYEQGYAASPRRRVTRVTPVWVGGEKTWCRKKSWNKREREWSERALVVGKDLNFTLDAALGIAQKSRAKERPALIWPRASNVYYKAPPGPLVYLDSEIQILRWHFAAIPQQAVARYADTTVDEVSSRLSELLAGKSRDEMPLLTQGRIFGSGADWQHVRPFREPRRIWTETAIHSGVQARMARPDGARGSRQPKDVTWRWQGRAATQSELNLIPRCPEIGGGYAADVTLIPRPVPGKRKMGVLETANGWAVHRATCSCKACWKLRVSPVKPCGEIWGEIAQPAATEAA